MKNLNSKNTNITKKHKELLGLDIPENYFEDSKKAILKSVSSETKNKQNSSLIKLVSYSAAALLVILLGLNYFINKTDITTNPTPISVTDILETTDYEDLSVNTLFIKDDNLDVYIDDFLENNLISELEQQETELENILLDTLFKNDSVIDEDIDEILFIETT